MVTVIELREKLRHIDEYLVCLDREDGYPTEVCEAVAAYMKDNVQKDAELAAVEKEYYWFVAAAEKYRDHLLAEREKTVQLLLPILYAEWREEVGTICGIDTTRKYGITARKHFSKYARLRDYTGEMQTIPVLTLRKLEEGYEKAQQQKHK